MAAQNTYIPQTSSAAEKIEKASSYDSSKSQVSYDPNIDYQARINDAVKQGDMTTAAMLERQRNAKIDGVNANLEAKFAALEKSQLEQRIAEQSARIASLEMDNRMYGVVRYPNGYTYNAGVSPFCGCNSGCGCA